jgi:DNA uptake protein ComE-like DNA-binding protein
MWIAWAFFPVVNWVVWIAAGIKTKRSFYFALAVIYSIPFIAGMMTVDRPAYKHIEDMASSAAIFSWIIGIAHILFVKQKINQEIAATKQIQGQNQPVAGMATTAAPTRYDTTAVYNPALTTPSPAVMPSQLNADTQPAYQTSAVPAAIPIDLNFAEEATIAFLPGVGPILAKKAVQVRAERHGFRYFDEFCDALALQPHIREKIRPLVTLATPETGTPAQKPNDPDVRVVDI